MSRGKLRGTSVKTDREIAEEEALRFITRRAQPSWTEEDAARLEAWLSAAAGHQAAYFRLNIAWQEAGRLQALGTMPARSARSAFGPVRAWALAACVVMALAGGALFFRDALFSKSSYSTVVGGLQTIPTRDGSKVTLNTDSRVRVRFDEAQRSVELTQGEAFFEVARDAKRPFIVTAGKKRIVAIGTQFSVRREGDEDVRVVVAEGTVRVESTEPTSAGDGAGTVLLKAGAIAQSKAGAVLVQKRSVAEVEQRLTWRTGILTFRGTTLAEAVAEFNRYNEHKIVIEDAQIAGIEVGGVFRSTNVEPFVQLLEDGFDVAAVSQDGKIVLRAKFVHADPVVTGRD
jgi:transmembrane sensor